jgi:hypothetical protein
LPYGREAVQRSSIAELCGVCRVELYVNRPPKIDLARRNALKAAGLVFGTILATGVPHKQASAQSQAVRGGGSGVFDTIGDIICDIFCSKSSGTFRGNNSGTGGASSPGTGGYCFARGTQIRTRGGYRPIETLAVGDEVAVHFGGFAPIKAMVGHTLNCVAGKWDDDLGNLPIVVRRDALGENLPTADLCVTAWHPVYVDGFLVPVGDLVNGTSILIKAADGQDSLEFFNVELECHNILDVQGAFFESLQRAGTERCAPYLRLCGGRSKLRSHMRSMASVVIDRRQPIDVIRDRLEERGLGLARAA